MTSRKPVGMPDTSQAGASPALTVLTDDAPTAVVRVDPRTLVLDANVRADADLTQAFVASVREHGVLVPVLVRRDTLGQAHVVDGQRRTLAAIEADQASVPVAWVDGVGDDEARIVDQLVINEHRTDLRPAHKVAAFKQLALLGRSAETIAKRTTTDPDVVTAALAVADSLVADMMLERTPEMPLDVAAVVAEFDGDDARVTELQETFEQRGAGQVQHLAQRWREDDAAEAAVREVEARLHAEGVVTTREAPSGSVAHIDDLTSDPGAEGYPPAIKPEEHAACPARAIWLQSTTEWTGRGWAKSTDVREREVCLDWKKSGHFKRSARNTAGATSGPMSEEEKAERAELIANNKAAVAAATVRAEWVKELMQRPAKAFPKDAVPVVARLVVAVAGNQFGSTSEAFRAIGHAELGSGYWLTPERSAALGSPHKATAFLLAAAFAEVEEHMQKDFWRSPQERQVVMLEALASWGYTLSDVEQLAVDTLRKPKRKAARR